MPFIKMLTYEADLALVTGGYNSLNTSHLVELCEEKLPTYYINSEQQILAPTLIRHYNLHQKQEIVTEHFLPDDDRPVTILLTCGSSCPDSIVEGVLLRIVSLFPDARPINEVMDSFR